MSPPHTPPGARPEAAAVADQQRWLEAVLDLLPLPSLLVEPGSGRVQFTNRAAKGVCTLPLVAGSAMPSAAAMTDHAGDGIPAEGLPWQRAARGESLAGQEVSWETAQGRVSFLVYSGTVPAMHGHAALTVLTFLDVTPLKATEAELRQAVEARDEFFSVATHELKDPLFSLQMSIQLLRRTAQRQGDVPASVLQHLEVSQRQADRLGTLIDNLLDVSRIASQRVQLDLEAFDLCDLTHEVAERFQGQARATGAPLTVEHCESIIGYWDRLKIEQVAGNLLANALKYGAGKPVTVRVCATSSTAFLQVEDRGVGIAEADQRRVFERFERVSADHKRHSMGLGLYIVRSLVEAHGGSVALESKVGVGSVFTVQLPRKRLHQPATGSAEQGT